MVYHLVKNGRITKQLYPFRLQTPLVQSSIESEGFFIANVPAINESASPLVQCVPPDDSKFLLKLFIVEHKTSRKTALLFDAPTCAATIQEQSTLLYISLNIPTKCSLHFCKWLNPRHTLRALSDLD